MNPPVDYYGTWHGYQWGMTTTLDAITESEFKQLFYLWALYRRTDAQLPH
jgi:hypothetical protein